ncbi:MAG: S9 family peptidase [Chitinophagaceae bacterium]|nr:MAG: S9 family peptidase [Chitinophagaceae bacterium]
MQKLVFVLLLSIVATCAYTQTPTAEKANYQLASRFSGAKLERMVFSTSVDPHWLKNSDRFWYSYETTEGRKWYLVDPLTSQKRVLFDNDKMAAELTRIVRDPFDAQHLLIDSLMFIKNENAIQFQVKSSLEVEIRDTTTTKKDTTSKRKVPGKKEIKTFYFEYDLASGKLTELTDYKRPKRNPRWASVSPDKSMIVFSKNHNLYWMDQVNYEKAMKNEDDTTIVETKLTTDGIEHFSFGGGGMNENNVDKIKNKNKRKPVYILWSADSKHFATMRTDQRSVKELWVINSVAEPRPTLETYKYQMPGEKEAPVEHLLVFDAVAKTYKELDVKQFKDQNIGMWSAPALKSQRDDDWRPAIWHGTNDKLYFHRTSRDLKRIDICMVDINTGTVKPLIEERMNTYVELRRLGVVNGGQELIQWSERDGWAHFYLYDGAGKLKNQITSGPFHCEDILGIDEKKRILYFEANGREPNEDPYYKHTYRINFDGTDLRLLDKGEFEHNVSVNDNNRFFVDNYSRVNTVPKSALYNNEGRKIMDLETADFTSLMASGYKFPEIFKVKADDGITDLYGVLYKPYNFDSTKKYPVVEYVYPGPQTEAVNKAFAQPNARTDRLAQIGLLVVTVGNRGGNPARSKWYHNYGYGNLRDYGLADKKAAVEQLADRYPYVDIDRVGIHGHSGGGFMSTAAMLVYPDFFKVAVSSSGNHDNSIYNRWWSEKHHGVKEQITDNGDTSFVYNIDKNPELAKNLKGRLMLTTGDIDNNVHPANTIRVANALIKANKRFDLVILPGQRHGYADMSEYFFYVLADYYAKWLIGDFSQSVDIYEMNREMQQTGKRR